MIWVQPIFLQHFSYKSLCQDWGKGVILLHKPALCRNRPTQNCNYWPDNTLSFLIFSVHSQASLQLQATFSSILALLVLFAYPIYYRYGCLDLDLAKEELSFSHNQKHFTSCHTPEGWKGICKIRAMLYVVHDKCGLYKILRWDYHNFLTDFISTLFFLLNAWYYKNKELIKTNKQSTETCHRTASTCWHC